MLRVPQFTNTRAVVCTAAAILASAYFFIKWRRQRNYFRGLNIPSGPKPYPFFGNSLELLDKNLIECDYMLIEKYANEDKVVGYYEGSSPAVLCADPVLAKNIFIKDFNHFMNRRSFEALLVYPADKFLTSLKDDEWKSVRSVLTTTFTTGKLKAMSKLMVACSDVIVKHIEKMVAEDQYFDSKNIFGCYSLDVITSSCFGIQTDAINDQNSVFIQHLKQFFDIDFNPKFIFALLFPKLAKLGTKMNLVQFFALDSLDHIGKVVNSVIKRRKSKIETREDFIQTMIEQEEDLNNDTKKNAENEGGEWKTVKRSLTSREIIAQAIMFTVAGYETTASALTFVSYNLALNPDCQAKLCADIDEALQKHGQISYDMVNDIPYLDMVINESMRIYPPGLRFDRVTSADYKYKNMTIPKDTVVIVPVYLLHHDAKYYPDPEKFIPERFTPEAKKEYESNGVFMPFGIGPRNCIGIRFALLEMKILLCNILSKYEFKVCDKTPMKIEFVNFQFIRSKQPIVLKISKRSDSN